MTVAYDNYKMIPAEHIKAAERLANTAIDVNEISSDSAQVYATLSVAHATIALAQMTGAMRA